MKNIAYMFHKIFVKLQAEAFFYKLSIINIFNRILRDKASLTLPRTPGFNALCQFIEYCTKKLFKNLQFYPMLFLELLFNKSKGDCHRIQNADLESDALAGVLDEKVSLDKSWHC